MKHSTPYLKRAFALVLFVYLTVFGLLGMSQTPDGVIPADEMVCEEAELGGALKGLCNAYCEAGPGEYLVNIDSIHFFNNIVTDIWVFVAPEWLESDVVSLAIEIWVNNDGFHEHGSQELLVSATTLIAADQVDALVLVDWTTLDLNITHSPEDYTACVQAMVDGQPFGVEYCRTLGPF